MTAKEWVSFANSWGLDVVCLCAGVFVPPCASTARNHNQIDEQTHKHNILNMEITCTRRMQACVSGICKARLQMRMLRTGKSTFSTALSHEIEGLKMMPTLLCCKWSNIFGFFYGAQICIESPHKIVIHICIGDSRLFPTTNKIWKCLFAQPN